MLRTHLRFADVLKAVQPELVGFVHQMAASGWILAVSGPDACLFSDDEAIRGLRDEMPGVVMVMAALTLISPEGDPADTLICQEFDDAGLDRAVEDFKTIECALARLAGCLVHNIFDDY